jgi:hypothetical protein
MLSLVYTSVAAKPFNKESVGVLLERARARNALYGITGMLLLDYGLFLQVLEGHAVDVEEVFASILRDPRHKSIRVLSRQTIEAREFASWTMAYQDISGVVALPAGHHIVSFSSLNAGSAQDYLRFFRPRNASGGGMGRG